MSEFQYVGSAKAEWGQHWKAVLACSAGAGASVTHLGTIGVLLPSIQQEYQWPASQITAGMLIISIMSLVASGFVGAIVDRLGSRRIGLIGLVVYCGSFALLATSGPSIYNWLLLWALLGFGFVSITTTVWAPVIAKRFYQSRGLALAVILSGNGICIAALPIIATLLLENYGWRGALVGVAAVVAIISIPLVLLFVRDLPVVHDSTKDEAGSVSDEAHGTTVREAVLSSVYIRIAVSAVIFTIASIALVVHFVPILREGGIDARGAAAVASAIGLSMICGRLATGALLDRIHGSYIGAISFGMPAIACLLLLTGPGVVTAVVIALVIGFSMGSELDVVAYVSTRYFGLRQISAIYGTLVGLITFAAGVGPMLSSLMFDQFGNYREMILLIIPFFLLGSALMGSLPGYPNWQKGHRSSMKAAE